MAQDRVIALVAGPSGTGKSYFAAQFPNALIFDSDLGGGLAYADSLIKKNKSERIEAATYAEVLDDLKQRQRHGKLKAITTLVIDHLSTLQQEAVNRINPKGESDYGRSNELATREWRRIREFARNQDFNLICTAHMKGKWADGSQVGQQADGGKNVEADFSIVLHLRPTEKHPSTAWVSKWRRLPDDERGPIPRTFPFEYPLFTAPCMAGRDLAKGREPIPMATEEQVKELERLLDIVKVPEADTAKWLKKAGVDAFAEMDAATIGKCIEYTKAKAAEAAGKEGAK